METIEGGSWLGGFCAVLGVGGVAGYLLKGAAAFTGVGGAVLTVSLVGCAIYGLATA
ncbi:MAG: hypothetical protein K2Q21_04005 [Chitinophagaceae bacterium]|nr:hypothetical protein [Chitinophagaceae bacterium]